MIETTGDLWELGRKADATVITTNGIFGAKGAVMGRGCALEAKERFPDIAGLLAQELLQFGNHVHHFFVPTGRIIGYYWHILTFPVKRHWRDPADVELIERSAHELAEIVDTRPWQKIVTPRMGCGAGGLDWEDVKPIVEPFLNDRFLIVSHGDNANPPSTRS